MKNHRTNRSAYPLWAVALLVLGGAGVFFGGGAARAADSQGVVEKDIVETAVAAGSFKTLAAALEAADLVGALKGAGPFTVFAPTDEAFAKLPQGTVENLLQPENKKQLQAILLYHVVPGRYVAADVVKLDGKEVKTLEGGMVKIRTRGGVMVDMAKVVTTDVAASNGVIHVIDTVIMPKMKSGGM